MVDQKSLKDSKIEVQDICNYCRFDAQRLLLVLEVNTPCTKSGNGVDAVI